MTKPDFAQNTDKFPIAPDTCLSKRKADQDALTDALRDILRDVLTSDPYTGDEECSMTREIGRIKWFGGYDYKRNKENDYGYIERIGESDLYINKKHVTCSSTKLVEGVLVTFEIATDPKTGKAEARNLDLLEQGYNPTIIARCFDSEDPGFWQPVVKKYFEILDEDEMIEAAIKKLKILQFDRGKAIIADNIPIHILLIPQYKIFREHLSSEKCAYVYKKALDSYHDGDLSLDYILDEIEEKVKTQNALTHSSWLNVQDRIVWKKLIESRYREVIDVVKGCIPPKAEGGNVDWEPLDVYADITEEDRTLARKWMEAEGKTLEGSYVKMLSARCAEKVAQAFYRSLGFEVEDIARTQLRGSGCDWTTHDLLLNKEIPIDVKNARTPFNSWDRYVNHCVPRFKNTRDNIEVVIVGVLSPYISADGPKGGLWESPIRVLGEIRRSRIRELENEFLQENTPFVESASFIVRSTIPPFGYIISPWLFDYPTMFYTARDTHRHQLRSLDAGHIPDFDVFRTLGVNPVPAFLAAGLQLSPHWNILSDWQQEFYGELLGRPLDLPNVFLSILGHFLRVVSSTERHESYHPNQYKTLLYVQPDSYFNESPLGIYDPLDIVYDLCKTLGILWERRESTELHKFYAFKFNGLGLLQGKKRGDGDKWTTIIAYCGGITEKKVKCGFSPLILGEHESCPYCRRLICPKCGYCSLLCKRSTE